jgi:hypothetical protein
MRIAYISLHWLRTTTSGVGKKIVRQITAWRNDGHEVEFFMHSVQSVHDSPLVSGSAFFFQNSGIIKTEWERIRAASRLLKAVEDYKPDIIYLRYGMYVYPIHQIASIAPVVEEINTNDLAQHDDLGKLYSIYNQATRGILLRVVNGLVTMTRELALIPAFADYKKPTRVIANGIDLKSITPFDAPGNKTPRLLFTVTPGYYWHGLDKLITFAADFPDLIVEVAGYDSLPNFPKMPVNIKLLGYLKGDTYKEALARADIAIGSLALHRAGIEEACPLKTRECLAYGLPMVLPYTDSDLENTHADFLLKIPNKEDNIQTHGKIIHDFAYQMRGRRVDREHISNLDNAHKEVERLKFFKEFIHK